jgi:hypothetical protein
MPAAEQGAVPAGWKGAGIILLVDDEESVRPWATGCWNGWDSGAGGRRMGGALEIYRRATRGDRAGVARSDHAAMDGEETFRELRRIDNRCGW